MHSNTVRALVISFITATAAAGCGKESVPAQDTTAKKTDEKATDSEPAASDDAKQDESAASEEGKTEKKKKKDDGFSVERQAKDYLTAPDVVFMYAFKESDAGVKADKVCEEKSKGDNEQKGKCMNAARKKVSFDGYSFEQDESGKWYWEVVKVNDAKISYLHKVPIEFGKETDKTVEIKVVGKDEAKGAKGGLPNEVTFETPNAYQIVQTESPDGKIVLEAKLGLLGDPATKKKKR
jgi:hypothetical protein